MDPQKDIQLITSLGITVERLDIIKWILSRFLLKIVFYIFYFIDN